MLTIGYNIKQKDDKLRQISLEEVYKMLYAPKQDVIELIGHLHRLKALDTNAYRNQKTRLPYIVPSLFNPPFRKTENFGSSHYFILDFDHLEQNNFCVSSLKEKMAKDSRVAVMFASPSGDGLKIIVRLSQKIFDHNKYKIAYQAFVRQFEKDNLLLGIADYSTCDVTRACFLSYDQEVYFNANAQSVDIDKIVNFDNFFEVKEIEKEIILKKPQNEKNCEIKELDTDIFGEIKMLMNPLLAKKQEIKKQIYVPPELEQIVEIMTEYLQKFKVNTIEVKSINYGKKIIVGYEHHKAEVNVFFGSKGFSVVRSPKNGTNNELMELTFSILTAFFQQYNSF